MIKKIVGKIIPIQIKKQLINFKILSLDYGQYNSIREWNAIDANKNEIPWYTYPAIEYLNNLDFSKKLVFEYGSGNSSTYWSIKSKQIVSIEHDKTWYDKVKLKLNNNQTLLFQENNIEYENSLEKQNIKYDVVIIDGIRRPLCSKIIDDYLNKDSKEGYMVILDNSDWYKETSKYLREKLNLIEVDFHGFGPINAYTWTTSIFISRNFNFKPINKEQPNFSIAGIEQNGD